MLQTMQAGKSLYNVPHRTIDFRLVSVLLIYRSNMTGIWRRLSRKMMMVSSISLCIQFGFVRLRFPLGGWVDTHHNQVLEDEVADMKLEDPEPRQVEDEDEVPLDMEEFEAAGLLDAQDDTTLRTIPPPISNAQTAGAEIMQTRYSFDG